PHGSLTYSIFTHGGETLLTLKGSAQPPEGFALVPLYDSLKPEVEIDGSLLKAEIDFRRRKTIPIPPGSLSVKVVW
ncbi:MAG: hypothetical protein KJ645_12000, partial [Planctomycetes bacterium]|nr:hypothetical protein [Planctomycetota bacterium]